jgi:acetyltransferase-like isoleucine patch superfamily enzyme
MLAIGDDATVDTMFQAHSFEDRVLKLDHVKVGPRVTLRRGSVILYGATFGEGCILEGHSVVMKNEKLLPRRVYVGAPTQPLR